MNWKPKKWIAILLGFLVQPIGMLYIARVKLAIVYYLAGIVVGLTDYWFALNYDGWGQYFTFALMFISAIHVYLIVKQDKEISIRPWYSKWYGLLSITLIPLLMIFSFRAFLFEPFRMPSVSMSPSINPKDIMVASKWGYGNYATYGITLAKTALSNELKRGDVIVLEYPKDPAINYVERVIGLPNDVIEYDKDSVIINGKKALRVFENKDSDFEIFSESIDSISYRIKVMPTVDSVKGQVSVPEGHIFVMGDNRDNSNDSRYWGFVPIQNIVGKVVYILEASQ